jgi:hypothetical protein
MAWHFSAFASASIPRFMRLKHYRERDMHVFDIIYSWTFDREHFFPSINSSSTQKKTHVAQLVNEDKISASVHLGPFPPNNII